MFAKLRNFEQNFSVAKAAWIIGVFTLLSRLAGWVRDLLLASKFGAGDTLDVYFAAFRVPDFVFNLLILGTLSVAFIPIFTEHLLKDKKRANDIANSVLNTSVLGMAAICLVLFIFARPLSKLLVPGFSPQKLGDTVTLMKIFLISPILFTASSVFSSIQQAHKKFLIASVAPILYNLGIIFGVIFLYPCFGLKGLGYGVILGVVMHMAVQAVYSGWHLGFKWRFLLDFKDAAVRKISKLFVPRIIGVDISQISLIIGSVISSFLASGSIAIFNFSNNLNAVPIGVFAISLSSAVFPLLCEQYASNNEKQFVETLGKLMAQILFFIIPISILVLLFRAHIVRLSLGYGHFNWTDTRLTFSALGVMSFSLFAQGLAPLLSRAFYARQNTLTPVIVNLASIVLNAGLAYYFGKMFGIVGVAAGFSVASIVNALALFLLLRRKLHREILGQETLLKNFDSFLFKDTVKIILASVIMGLAGYGFIYLMALFVNTHTVLGLLLQAAVSGGAAVIVFIIVAGLLGLSQTKAITKYFSRQRPAENL